VPQDPLLKDFRKRITGLAGSSILSPHIRGDEIQLANLTLDEVGELIQDEAGYYLLIAAAGLNRTSLKRAMKEPDAQIVSARQRKAFAIRKRLPTSGSFQATAETSAALREADLRRKGRGEVEQLFRERLKEEGIPVLMSPPTRRVPGLLIGKRKPDGVYPDPESGRPPKLYLEVKSIRRVADDIQKRLYEIAEASLEMKAIYGDLRLEGLRVTDTSTVECSPDLRARLREQITASDPVVVALFICPRNEAERYRLGAETFIDRIFFQEEIRDCLDFLKETIEQYEERGRS
jgi:hypothetical protein